MILLTAIQQSLHGIAIRRRVTNKLKTKIEVTIAVLSDQGIAHIINCRNATIRRVEPTDQARTDWEPFQPMPEKRRSFRKAPASETTNLGTGAPVPKSPGRPKKVKVKPEPGTVCFRCEQPSEERLVIGVNKWLCPACLPRQGSSIG